MRVSDWLPESDRICSSYDVFLDSFTKLSDRLFRLNLDYCFLKLRNPGVVFSFCPGKLSLLIFCFAPTFLKRCQHISDKTASAGSPAACYNDILNILLVHENIVFFNKKYYPKRLIFRTFWCRRTGHELMSKLRPCFLDWLETRSLQPPSATSTQMYFLQVFIYCVTSTGQE